MARPKLRFSEAERRKVSVLAAYGVPPSVLAEAYQIAESSVRKHFAQELSAAAIAQRANLLLQLYRKAARGNGPASRFWLKTFYRDK